jgi:hypothetical protein
MIGGRRKKLADASELYIGPETKRFREVHKQIRAASDALDSGRCMDASMHLIEAQDLMKAGRSDVGAETRNLLADEKRRLKQSCHLNLAAYKPEQIPRHVRTSPGSEARARRSAKKASTRVSRRAAKRDPEGAPTRRRTRGWID